MVDKLRTLWEKAENILKIGRYTNASGADGQLSKVQLKTLRNIEDAFKMGQFGFNSKAPVGSRCVVAQIGNDAMVIANEHIASIIDITSGDTVVYNETGSFIKIVGGSIQFKSDTIDFDCNTIKHRGVSIDNTHIHAQGNDSSGSVEQNVTPPIN